MGDPARGGDPGEAQRPLLSSLRLKKGRHQHSGKAGDSPGGEPWRQAGGGGRKLAEMSAWAGKHWLFIIHYNNGGLGRAG